MSKLGVVSRRPVALVSAAGLVAVGLLAAGWGSASAGTPLFNQTFMGATAPGFVAPAAPDVSGGTNAACLTASAVATQTPIPGCNLATPDTAGSGALRLTSATGFQEGGVIYGASVPTTQGLDVSFDSYQYGPSTVPADGIAFVLAAANPSNPVPPTAIGGVGGSLGYSPYQNQTNPGMTNGYLGIGFDSFGNYSNTGYDGTGCTDPSWMATDFNRNPDQVSVHGPGNSTTGYCPLNSTLEQSGSVLLVGGTRATSKIPVEVAINPGTAPAALINNPGASVAAGSYEVLFTDLADRVWTLTGALPSTMNGGIPAGSIPAAWINPTTGIPYQLTFGWVGSTGSDIAVHEITSVSAESLSGAPVLFAATNTDSGAGSLTSGSPATWTIGVSTTAASAPEANAVSINDVFPSSVQPSSASGTGWVCTVTAATGEVSCTYAVTTPLAPGSVLPPITIGGTPSGAPGAAVDSTVTVSSVDGLPVQVPDNAVIASTQPTALSATPALLKLETLSLYLLTLNATLTNAAGAGIPGQTINFTAGGSLLCSAQTNGAGTASCSILGSLTGILSTVLGNGYTASFAATGGYAGSQASAGLIG